MVKQNDKPNQGIQMDLFDYFAEAESFTLAEANDAVLNHYNRDVKVPSIRARIYEGIDKGLFERVSKGVYSVTKKGADGVENTCLLINGDGRDLSMIEDNSIDALITDHPYKIDAALKGGNRDFASYELFRYEQKDFDEKCRVLKPGAFLLEFLPEESEANFEYLYEVKKMAIEAGFKYFAKVPWKKGDFVANTGRTSKNREDIMFFSKGEPRALRLDAKKNKAAALNHGLDIKGLDSYGIRDLLEEHGLEISYMKGAGGMLPTEFDFQPRGKKEKVMEAEKPVELFDAILPYITMPGEKVLDTFAGGGGVGISAVRNGRDAILIEKDENTFEKLKARVEEALGEKAVLEENIRVSVNVMSDAELAGQERALEFVDAKIECYKEVLANVDTKTQSAIPDKLYHATYGAYLSPIVSEGLKPVEHSNWKGCERGYVYLASEMEAAVSYCENSYVFDEIYDTGIYCFEIDVASLDKDSLLPDPNFVLWPDDPDPGCFAYPGVIPFDNMKLVYKDHDLETIGFDEGIRWFSISDSKCVSVWYSPDDCDAGQFQMHLENKYSDGSMGRYCEVLSSESYATADTSYQAVCETLNEIYEDAGISGIDSDSLIRKTAKEIVDAFSVAEKGIESMIPSAMDAFEHYVPAEAVREDRDGLEVH